MTSVKKDALVSAFRVVLGVLAGWFFASYIGNAILAAGLDFTSAAIVAYWSYYEKTDSDQTVLSMLMGPLRNLAASIITYATVRGWIDPELAKQLLPALIAIAAALWGVEQKVLVNAKYLVPFLLAGMLGLGLYGCGGMSTVDQLNFGLTAADTGYHVYCSANGKSGFCTAADNRAEHDAVVAAQEAIDTYAQAEADGNAGQTLLDHANALIADALRIIADIKHGKHKS